MKKKIKIILKKKKPIPFYDYERDGITQGMLGMWMQCREQARLFLQGYSKGGTTMGLTYGSVGHGVLEHAYENFRLGKNPGAPTDRQMSKYLIMTEKQWKLENPRPTRWALEDLEVALMFAKITLPVYFDYWKNDFKKKNWQKVEGRWKIPFILKDGRKVTLRGMMDGMFKTKGMWLFESKFLSRINEGDIIDTLPLNLQVRLYLRALWKTQNVVPSGVLYNVVRRIGLKQGKKETLKQFANRCAEDLKKRPEWYFYRFEVDNSKEDLLVFEEELHGMVQDFCDWYDGTGNHYKNSGSCIRVYGRCDYLDACSDHSTHNLIKRKVVFRELEDI